jgi:hypothetical protein
MRRLAKYELEEGNDDLMDVADRTNEAPLSAIDMEALEWVLDKLVGRKPSYKLKDYQD